MTWRRTGGAVLMGLGGAVVLAMLALAAIVGANFVEPGNIAENLVTIAAVTLPPALGGVILIALGRAVHGDWGTAHPLKLWGGRALLAAGALAALTLAILLLVSLPRGFGEDNRGLLIQLVVGVLGCLLLAWTGRRLSRESERRSS